MSIIRKVILYSLLLALIASLGFTVFVYFNKEKIIQAFVVEANKQLNTPVKIGAIDVSVWSSFPDLAIVLTDVYVEDSQPGTSPLLTSSELSFRVNPVEVWQGDYTIRGIHLEDAEVSLQIAGDGTNNYDIVKKSGSGKRLSFMLNGIHIERCRVRYDDVRSNEHFDFSTDLLRAAIRATGDVYLISADGSVAVNGFVIDKTVLPAGKTFKVDTELKYTDNERRLEIQSGTLGLHQSAFSVHGFYAWLEQKQIELHVDGKETDIQTLLSLLPEDVSSRLGAYQSHGNVFFTLALKGKMGGGTAPSMSATFGFHNTTLFHPVTGAHIENASLEGSFATPSLNRLDEAALVLRDVKGDLEGRAFEAMLTLHNLNDPYIQFQLKGSFDLHSVLSFYPLKNVKDASGMITADVTFQGKTAWLKDKSTVRRAVAAGTIIAEGIALEFGGDRIPLRDLRGTLQFTNNDLALSDVVGRAGASDFVLNGMFKNIVAYLLFSREPLGIEADLRARYLSLDEVFGFLFGQQTESNSGAYQFSIAPNLSLNFNYHVDALRYRRFYARNVKGDLLVKNRVAVSRGMSMHTMGGDLSLTGIVDAHDPGKVDIVGNSRLDGVHIDSIFFVFENFRQDFIQDKHLRGQAYADVSLEMTLNENLRLLPETLISDIGIVIRHGELNHFEPMRKLDKYLDDEGLDHLRFADLHNDIHIENKRVYIPQMGVRTNVTAIDITGTHTFDQHIDYHVIAPLRNKGKVDLVEASNAIEEDNTGHARLYLKITGTTDDYRVSYDTDAIKKKIITDLKSEVQELRDAFKNKGQTREKALELSDETFDWDN